MDGPLHGRVRQSHKKWIAFPLRMNSHSFLQILGSNSLPYTEGWEFKFCGPRIRREFMWLRNRRLIGLTQKHWQWRDDKPKLDLSEDPLPWEQARSQVRAGNSRSHWVWRDFPCRRGKEAIGEFADTKAKQTTAYKECYQLAESEEHSGAPWEFLPACFSLFFIKEERIGLPFLGEDGLSSPA